MNFRFLFLIITSLLLGACNEADEINPNTESKGEEEEPEELTTLVVYQVSAIKFPIDIIYPDDIPELEVYVGPNANIAYINEQGEKIELKDESLPWIMKFEADKSFPAEIEVEYIMLSEDKWNFLSVEKQYPFQVEIKITSNHTTSKISEEYSLTKNELKNWFKTQSNFKLNSLLSE